MRNAIIASAMLLALVVAGCSSGPEYNAEQNSGTQTQAESGANTNTGMQAQDSEISGMESDLNAMQEGSESSDFSGYEFLEVDESTFD